MIGAIARISKRKDPKKTSNIPSLNLLPEEFQKRRFLRRNGRYMFFLVVEGVILAFLVLTRGTLAGEGATYAKSRLLPSQGKTSAEMTELQNQLAQVSRDKQSILRSRQDLEKQRKPWKELLEAIIQAAPPGVNINSAKQVTDKFTIAGTADSTELAMQLRKNLLDNPIITQVPVGSLSRSPSGQVSFKMDIIYVKKAKP